MVPGLNKGTILGINEIFQNGVLQEHGNLENFISFPLFHGYTLSVPGFKHVFSVKKKKKLFEILSTRNFYAKELDNASTPAGLSDFLLLSNQNCSR